MIMRQCKVCKKFKKFADMAYNRCVYTGHKKILNKCNICLQHERRNKKVVNPDSQIKPSVYVEEEAFFEDDPRALKEQQNEVGKVIHKGTEYPKGKVEYD